MDAGTLLECSAEELQEALTQFEAGRCAVHQAELDLIATFEDKAFIRLEGAASMPAWLCLKFGWSSRHAYQVVRVARALARLPLIRDAYGQGRICWESVVALSRIADRDNEAELLDNALRMTSTDLKALLTNLDPVHTPEANRAHEQRFLRYSWDLDARVLHLKGMLADVDGVVVAKALEHLAGRRNPETLEAGSGEQVASAEPEPAQALAYDPTPRPSFEQACADAPGRAVLDLPAGQRGCGEVNGGGPRRHRPVRRVRHRDRGTRRRPDDRRFDGSAPGVRLPARAGRRGAGSQADRDRPQKPPDPRVVVADPKAPGPDLPVPRV